MRGAPPPAAGGRARGRSRGAGMADEGASGEARGDLVFTARERRALLTGAAALLLLGVLWAFGATSWERGEDCRTCLSLRTTGRWGIGLRGRGPLLAGGTGVEVVPSALFHLLPPGHEHEWRETTVSSRLFGLSRDMGCSSPRPNPLAARLGSRTAVLTAVEFRLADGLMTREELAALVSLPNEPDAAWLADPGRRLLLERAQALLEQEGVERRDPGWERALGR
ncbi:MAG: hypothetical protein L6R43_02350 [Planctomycetes bacterium]|nr:hypothetical protein [Planctomycetota bacterium]